jgi:hypothetical protein
MIKEFTVYKTETGIIEHNISANCNIEDIPIKDSESIVEGNYSPSQYKFINGEPVEIDINDL